MKRKFLKKKDVAALDRVLRKTTEVRTFRRALILKMRDAGYPQKEICKLILGCERTVRTTTKLYEREGFAAALHDKPRSGQPRRFNKEQETRIAAVVCSDPPQGHARWTLTLLKEHSEKEKIVDSISTETLRIILVSRDIKPWKHKMWCVPRIDAAFIRPMEDVLALYEKDYDPTQPVVCLDEKPIQLLNSYRPQIRVNAAVRQDYEYARNGVVNAFCAIEPKAGRHFTIIRKQKKLKDFALVVKRIVNAYPNAKTVHLVMDNLSTHSENALIQTFGSDAGKLLWSKITPHYTPKHASWLNQAEIEISMFSRTCLGKTRVSDIKSLRKRAAFWTKDMNRKKIKINWAFSRRKARSKFKYKPAKIKLSWH